MSLDGFKAKQNEKTTMSSVLPLKCVTYRTSMGQGEFEGPHRIPNISEYILARVEPLQLVVPLEVIGSMANKLLITYSTYKWGRLGLPVTH